MGNGGVHVRGVGAPDGQMDPRSYPALPFCFDLEGCRLADAREGGVWRGSVEVALEGPAVGTQAGTRSRLGFSLASGTRGGRAG